MLLGSHMEEQKATTGKDNPSHTASWHSCGLSQLGSPLTLPWVSGTMSLLFWLSGTTPVRLGPGLHPPANCPRAEDPPAAGSAEGCLPPELYRALQKLTHVWAKGRDGSAPRRGQAGRGECEFPTQSLKTSSHPPSLNLN